ncbi:class I SAM-dependent methyltransferase [Stenotrophomonas lacuserhaii]|uniref:class I SAM-dependent methyltransferase n=1 Tax=Stenotrophomonas lacuserhaii TaxID=2760084 RepID=UPI001CB72774|nr:class I SAM-dependent methyltransferase [Stenotrophomonas lacuserhaii]
MQKVPGLLDMQRMARLLLEERVPADATVLVLGAGGGMELLAFAEAQAGWHFHGIDPSAPMLDMARQRLGPLASRVAFTEGYIDDAPEEVCDGAACLLTLHFLPAGQRLHTLKAMRRRLKPGAPLVVAHHSYPQDDAQKGRWLQRFAAFSASSGIALDVAHTVDSMARLLPALSPEQDVALLHEAGFGTVELFYAAFSFRGWVAYAG